MSTKSSRLSNLIPDVENEAPRPAGGVHYISIDEVRPGSDQPRRTIDPERLEDLVASIRINGIIQPLLVRPVPGGYEIVAGERRYRAACMAGLKKVPAIARTVDRPGEALELALIENLQREDLNPIEEAVAYQRLLDEYDYTQELLSHKLGRSRSAIANAIRLLKLPEEVQDGLAAGRISVGHGKVLLGVEDHDLARQIYRTVLERSLSVRQTESLIKQALSRRRRRATGKGEGEDDARYQPLCSRLGEYLQTRVSIRDAGKSGKGRIVIEFASGEDLERIVESIEREL